MRNGMEWNYEWNGIIEIWNLDVDVLALSVIY
jgi:hypothetical protein